MFSRNLKQFRASSYKPNDWFNLEREEFFLHIEKRKPRL